MRTTIICGMLAAVALLTPLPSHADSYTPVQYRDRDRYPEERRHLGPERRHEIERLNREIEIAREHRDWRRVRYLERRRDDILDRR